MKRIDLGFETPDYSKGYGMTAPAEPEKPAEMPTKTAYPTLTIPSKALARSVQVGQKITAQVEFVVTEVMLRERKGDTDDRPRDIYDSPARVELDAISMTMNGVNVDESEDEEDGVSAFRGFLSKRAKAAKNSEEDEEDEG